MTPRPPATAAVVASVVLALGAHAVAADAPPPRLTAERLHADPPLNGSLPSRLAWHPDGKRLTFQRRAGEATDLLAFDLNRAEPSVLLEGARLRVPGDPERALPLTTATWLADGRMLLVPAFGDIFVVDVATAAVKPLVVTPQTEESATASPDGRRVAFVRDNDLYSVEVATGRQVRLTQDGSETRLNGRLDWVYEEELGSRSGRAFAWSPDSRAIGYLQLDQSRVATFPIVDFLPVRNEVFWQRYPKAGTANSVPRIGVVAFEKDGSAGPSRLLPPADDVYLLPQLAWTRDSRQLVYQQLNRAQTELELRFLPVPSSAREPLGEARTVVHERSKTWVNTFDAPLFLKDNRRFLWMSERDGFAHVYVCEQTGNCRAVTQGHWAVDAQSSFAGQAAPLYLDERSGFLYYTSTEKDPRERHLFRTRLDGTGRLRLTREDGTHRTSMSPDGRYYVDTWSDAATPTKVWIASQDGSKRYVIEDNARPPILEHEMASLEWVEVSAKDGTRLYASLVKPAGFDPARRYPVVVNVYGGPHVQSVTNAWGQISPFDHLLASRGILVWSLDNRGSAGRGVAFESAIHRELGRVELEDQLAGVAYLQSLPYVDAERIGITGWSYGGFLTLYALTRAPRVFRSGVAGAPVTDWRHYDTIYTERYLGTPEANPGGYQASSTLEQAAALEAELLILHGTDDDNVHLANTMAFAAAAVKAGRHCMLAIHPRQRHGFTSKEDRLARDRAVLAHFERTLLRP